MTISTFDVRHVVKFYDDESALYSLVGDFLADGAVAGDPLVVISRGSRHSGFASALQTRGLDAELMLLDARQLLSTFMSDDMPDETLFMNHVGEIVLTAAARRPNVRAYGEMVDILWQDGNPEAALRLEEMWNGLAKRHRLSLFCAYAIGNFYKETDRGKFDAICSQHTHVLPATDAKVAEDPATLIARLQQRTLVLETEVRQRQELEGALRESLTARREGEAELRRLYELAQNANRAKDHFLATLSHELRTPLTAILGWARMLTLGGLDEETTRTALQTIEQSARMQATIVDDLLDLSKIVTGKIGLQRVPVDLWTVVDEAIQTCRLAAEAKNMHVRVERRSERPVVAGDATRLRQIVWNLYSNAIKYSDEGSEISITIDRSPREAMIVVRDNGRGIAPDFLPYIFEPFRQADNTSTRGYGGLGLGLTIVKHLTELHGGQVSVMSDGEGCGSTFTVTLPIVQTTVN